MPKMQKMTQISDVAKALKKARKQKKISQVELGGFANITAVAISRLENEETDPQLSTILRLAQLLNVNIYIEDRSNE